MDIKKLFFSSKKTKENPKSNTIEIEVPEGKSAKWVENVLTLVNDDIGCVMDRIKTFEDACEVLGKQHPHVISYYSILKHGEIGDFDALVAYEKLCIICHALNKGWTPTYEESEERYYPEFGYLSRNDVGIIESRERNAYKPDFDYSVRTSERTGIYFDGNICFESGNKTHNSHFLCFKSPRLAMYAGQQFIDIWADYILNYI